MVLMRVAMVMAMAMMMVMMMVMAMMMVMVIWSHSAKTCSHMQSIQASRRRHGISSTPALIP